LKYSNVYVKRIIDLIKTLASDGFTGKLTLTLIFNQGGVRDVKKTIEDKI